MPYFSWMLGVNAVTQGLSPVSNQKSVHSSIHPYLLFYYILLIWDQAVVAAV